MNRWAHLRSSLGVGLLCGLGPVFGCSSSDNNFRTTPGLTPEEQARLPKALAVQAETAPAAPAPFVDQLPSQFEGEATDESPAPDQQAPVAAAEQKEEEERDLGKELEAALGQPVDCLDLNKVVEGGGKAEVRVGAHVTPSGRITRVSVRAPGQPSETATCIEKRTLAIKMREPIEDAPRLVEATLKMEIARVPSP